MKNILISLFLIIILLVLGTQKVLSLTEKELVEQFFPKILIEESDEDFANGGPFPFKVFDFVVADLNGTGETFIIAAYSNGFSCIVRVLKKEDSTGSLVDEPNIPQLGGIFPKVQLLDLDNNESLEVIVSFSSAKGPTADWVFTWNGKNLELISPTSIDKNGNIDTILSDPRFVDIDRNGSFEIINPTGSGPIAPGESDNIGGVGKLQKYVLKNGKYFLIGDFDSDKDVDGVDLGSYIKGGTGVNLQDFASNFGESY